jgi:methionyl aminopeptidase
MLPFCPPPDRYSNTGIVIGMVELKTDTSIDAMREAGRVVGRA